VDREPTGTTSWVEAIPEYGANSRTGRLAMALESEDDWSGARPPTEFLNAKAKAPVPAPTLEPEVYRRVLSAILNGLAFPQGPRETAIASGVTYLAGAQRIIEISNRLLQGDLDPRRNQETLVQLLRCFLVLDRERASAYVLEQVALAATAQRPHAEGIELPRRRRLADFLSPLEEHLTHLAIPSRLEPPIFAALVVHLDDLYDDALLQLLRFFHLALEPLDVARALAGSLFASLYGDFVRSSLGDHLLGGETPPRPKARPDGGEVGKEEEPPSKTGLLSVLPLAIEALEAGA
jgi:hypothetical protein